MVRNQKATRLLSLKNIGVLLRFYPLIFKICNMLYDVKNHLLQCSRIVIYNLMQLQK